VPNIRELDPSASPLDYFGFELRRKREEAGLSQGQLGTCIFCTASLIGQVETAKKVPTREFAERVDVALGEDGTFSRLVGLVLRNQLRHLLSYRDARCIRLQVLPFGVGEHANLAGSFSWLRFDDDPDIVYTEDLIKHVLEERSGQHPGTGQRPLA